MKRTEILILIAIVLLIFLIVYPKTNGHIDLQPSKFIMRDGLPSYLYDENKREFTLGFGDYRNYSFDLVTVKDTGSMRPTISDNSFLLVINNPERDFLSVGDIIAFKCDNDLIVHRILEIKDEIYITKGDSNKLKDNCYTEFEDIESKIVGVLY